MNLCASRNYYTLVGAGDPCSTAEGLSLSMQGGSIWSSSYWPRTQRHTICSPGLTCLACDTTQPLKGICSKLQLISKLKNS